jgi:dTDP-4-dehydrorhamnose reductase
VRLLVTGAGGMLGRDVLLAADRAGHETHGFARAEVDITDEASVDRAFRDVKPDAVVNCAAWTDVDGAERQEGAATLVNGMGAGVVALAAHRFGATVVHVSTDYVFDGTKTTPYVESDPTGPRSAYGRSKLAGEEAVVQNTPRHHVVRASWLFGVGGPNFVKTMLRLASERDEVAVVTDQVGCPTFTGHLAPALLELAGGEDFGVWHVAGAGRCSWNEFARAIFAAAGIGTRVNPATSGEMARPAPRPAWSVLESERAGAPRLPEWSDGLGAYLAEERTAAS